MRNKEEWKKLLRTAGNRRTAHANRMNDYVYWSVMSVVVIKILSNTVYVKTK
jgi:hypothetical protein